MSSEFLMEEVWGFCLSVKFRETLTLLVLSPDLENWCFTLTLRNEEQDSKRPDDWHLQHYREQSLNLIWVGLWSTCWSIPLPPFQGYTVLTYHSKRWPWRPAAHSHTHWSCPLLQQPMMAEQKTSSRLQSELHRRQVFGSLEMWGTWHPQIGLGLSRPQHESGTRATQGAYKVEDVDEVTEDSFVVVVCFALFFYVFKFFS